MFKTYDCKVRINGSVMNEVPKYDVTAPEIEILRAWHGSDAVVGVVETGEVKRKNATERQRLYDTYAAGMAEQAEKKKAKIRALFGHDSMPLPEKLVDVAEEAEDDEGEDEEAVVETKPAEPIRRTRAAKQEASVLE